MELYDRHYTQIKDHLRKLFNRARKIGDKNKKTSCKLRPDNVLETDNNNKVVKYVANFLYVPGAVYFVHSLSTFHKNPPIVDSLPFMDWGFGMQSHPTDC